MCDETSVAVEWKRLACASAGTAPSRRHSGFGPDRWGHEWYGYLNLDTTKVPLLAGANLFTNNQTIAGTTSGFGLTVAGEPTKAFLSPGRNSLLDPRWKSRRPNNGMYWQIMNTGANASQGINKLNFRNDSAGIDALTLLPKRSGGIGTTSPNTLGGWLDVSHPE